MIRPIFLAVELEEKKVETEVEMVVSCTGGKDGEVGQIGTHYDFLISSHSPV